MGLAPSDVSLLLWPHLPIPRLGGWGPRWQWLSAPPLPPCRLPRAARRCSGQLLMEALFTFSEILWRSMPRLFSLPICQWCPLPHLLTQICPGISDHLKWLTSSGLVTTKRQLLGDVVKGLSPLPSKKEKYASFVQQHLGMRCRIKISRCDLFLLRFIFKPFWGWSLLWNVWYKFQPAWGESAEWMPSLLLWSTAVVRIISPSTWSVTSSGPQARNVGQAVGSLLNVPGLQFFSTSWTAFYIFFCLLSTITTLFIDAFFFFFWQNPSVHYYFLVYYTIQKLRKTILLSLWLSVCPIQKVHES